MKRPPNAFTILHVGFVFGKAGASSRRFHKELGLKLERVTRPNLGLILRSAGLGLVLSPKISLKLGRVF